MTEAKERYKGSEEFSSSLEPTYEKEEHAEEKPDKHVVEHSEPKETIKTKRAPKKPLEPHHHHKRKRFEVFSAAYIILLILFIVLLSASTDTTPFLVLVSFLPTLLTIVVALLIYEIRSDNKHVLWVVPFAFVYAFYWLGTSGVFFSTLDVDTLSALNIFACFLYLALNYLISQQPLPEHVSGVKTKTKVVVKEADIPADLATFIASIEDKSKALNFAIGRVYNAYHGGSRPLRQKINMKQEWYDEFSQLDPKNLDMVAVERLITTIEKRLRQLEQPEIDVFGHAHTRFKNLVRNTDGSERVIDVLDKNDKDPVTSYYEGALQFCGKVRELLDTDKAPIVENRYIEREDPKKKKKKGSWQKLKNTFR